MAIGALFAVNLSACVSEAGRVAVMPVAQVSEAVAGVAGHPGAFCHQCGCTSHFRGQVGVMPLATSKKQWLGLLLAFAERPPKLLTVADVALFCCVSVTLSQVGFNNISLLTIPLSLNQVIR